MTNGHIYDFVMKDTGGVEVPLSRFKGKVLLFVNVASKCGFTPQYEGLQSLYDRYREKGFEILGFPANDFLWQEPGTDQEILQFCSTKYGVSFPLFSKITVKGRNIHPLYRFLTEKETNPDFSGKITWNFNKFLIDRVGRIVNRFDSKVEPLDQRMIEAVEAAVNAQSAG
ncbi:MAG: glutathione peroxidase [Spirochaetia bacterium]|jgi:glutathione peroxidase